MVSLEKGGCMNFNEGLLTFSPTMSIDEIGALCKKYIAAEWRKLYESMHAELTASFPEIDDATYGLYLDKLMPPIFEALEKSGFITFGEITDNDFIIGSCLIFRNSIEKWGTEDERSRVFWNVVKNAKKNPIGTLLTDIRHSHHKFDIPLAPQIYVLKETNKEKIIAGIKQMKEIL
jgi:hypothetical protein